MFKETVLLAFKNLWSYKLRSLLMMGGIILGSTLFIVVNSVGDQYKAHVIKRVEKFGLKNIFVFPYRGKLRMPPGSDNSVTSLTLGDVQAIENEIAEIKYVSPARIKPGVDYKYNSKTTTASLHGVTPMWELVQDTGVDRGEFITSEDMNAAARVCVLGTTVARELFGEEPPVGQQILIQNVTFEVKGILVSKGAAPGRMGDLDNKVMIPITSYDKRLFKQDHLNLVGMALFDFNKMDQVEKQLTALLQERHRTTGEIEDDFAVRRPVNLIKTLTKTSDQLTFFLSILAAFSLVLSGGVIANIMLISIKDRKKEIGLRKAVGARNEDIFKQFLFESSIIAFPAAIIGFCLAIIATWILASKIGVTPAISYNAAVVGGVITIMISIISGIIPAQRASTLNPVDALRS